MESNEFITKDININLRIYFITSVLLLFSIFFLPSIKISSSLSIRIEDLIIFLVIMPFLLKEIIIINSSILLIASLAILEFISILVNKNIFYLSAIFEPFKILKFLLVLFIFYNIISQYEKKITKYIEIIFSILVVANLFQYYNILDFNYNVGKFYASETNSISFMESLKEYKRMHGLMGNPNNNAILFCFFYCFFMSLHLYYEKKRHLLYSIIAIIIVLICQSRTTLIALIFSILLLPLFLNFKRKFSKAIKIIFILLIPTIILYLIIPIFYIKTIESMNLDEINSWNTRLSVWDFFWGYIKQRPLLGSGGNKQLYYLMNIDVDSGYFWFMYNFGLITTLIYIFIFINQIYLSLKYKTTVFSYLSFAFSIIILITSITNAPFQEPRLNLLIAISTATFIFSLNKLRKKRRLMLQKMKV